MACSSGGSTTRAPLLQNRTSIVRRCLQGGVSRSQPQAHRKEKENRGKRPERAAARRPTRLGAGRPRRAPRPEREAAGKGAPKGGPAGGSRAADDPARTRPAGPHRGDEHVASPRARPHPLGAHVRVAVRVLSRSPGGDGVRPRAHSGDRAARCRRAETLI